MSKSVDSYLCVTCNAIVRPAYRWAGTQVAMECPGCGHRFRLVRPTPAILALVGPAPAPAKTGELFGEG
jgi:DNA-directed RNA polymerase subunit RPC12/RpoP